MAQMRGMSETTRQLLHTGQTNQREELQHVSSSLTVDGGGLQHRVGFVFSARRRREIGGSGWRALITL